MPSAFGSPIHGFVSKKQSHNSRTPYRLVAPQVGHRHGFSFDFMAVDTELKVYQTQFREMILDSDGWPVVTDNNFIP